MPPHHRPLSQGPCTPFLACLFVPEVFINSQLITFACAYASASVSGLLVCVMPFGGGCDGLKSPTLRSWGGVSTNPALPGPNPRDTWAALPQQSRPVVVGPWL